MRDVTEISLAFITLATVATLVYYSRGTSEAAQGVASGFAGILRAATFQGAGVGFGSGF